MEAAGVSSGPSKLALSVRATRPLYLPTSLLPGVAGCLVAVGADDVRWWIAPVAILALLLVHAGTDVINDVEDWARGTDSVDKVDNSRVFNTGLMSVAEGRRLGTGLLIAAALIGIAIAFVTGPAVLAFGVVGVLGGYLYTAGPRPYKYLGLGDPAIIFLMGPLLTQGAYAALTGDFFHAPAFFLGFAPGLMICAVLEGNNLSDIESDKEAGVNTLAVRIGFGPARVLFLVSLALAFATLPALWLAGLFDWPILVGLLAGVPAFARARQALAAKRSGDPNLATLPGLTAQVHILYTLLLVVGVVLSEAL